MNIKQKNATKTQRHKKHTKSRQLGDTA